MNAQSAFNRLMLAFVAWGCCLLAAAWQMEGPAPAHDSRWEDLRSLQAWVRPIAVNAARGRTVLVNPHGLNAVFFANTLQGWAVGEQGTILATNDGGKTWRSQNSGSTHSLNGVKFTSAKHGWAVGESRSGEAIVLRTENGGQTWQPQSANGAKALKALHFVDATFGWAVGAEGSVLTTQDGGQSWSLQQSGTKEELRSVHFIAPQLGWAVGTNGTIISTHDAGKTWQAQRSGYDLRLNSVYFVSPLQGWAVGGDSMEAGRMAGITLFTSNGGKNWQMQANALNLSTGLQFQSPQRGWALGLLGALVSTEDGGKTWEESSFTIGHSFGGAASPPHKQTRSVINGNTSETINTTDGGRSWTADYGGYVSAVAMHFIDPSRGWIVGWRGSILATADGGQTWQKQVTSAQNAVSSVYFTSPNQGLVGTNGQIWMTEDSGESWQPQIIVSFAPSSDLQAIHFLNPTQGWAVGDRGTILATRDGGRNWFRSGILRWGKQRLQAIQFSNERIGWAIGEASTLLETQDGGMTWIRKKVAANVDFRALHFFNSDRGWIVGDAGTILSTKDGGETWQVQASGTKQPLRTVHFTNESEGWAAGDGGTLLNTQDGGKTWITVSTGLTNDLRAIHFSTPQRGVVVGYQGTIIVTTDSGKSWQKRPAHTKENITNLSFATPDLGWAVGTNGTVLRTQNGGHQWENLSPDLDFWIKARFGVGNYSLWPSPLVMLMCGLLTLILVSAFAQFLIELRKQAKAGGIHDAPIDDLQSDRLERAPLVRALAQLFRNQNTRPPLAVALTAPWGVGKSSVLQMLRRELRGYGRCVYINPWHYPQDSQLLAALMTGICTQAVPPMLSWANIRFRCSLFALRTIRPHWRWCLVIAVLLALSIWPDSPLNRLIHRTSGELATSDTWAHVGPALQQSMINLKTTLPPTLQAWVGSMGQFLLWSLGLFLIWRKGLNSLRTFSPDLTQALAQSAKWAAKSVQLPDWSQHAGLRHQFAADFEQIARAFGSERLVLLIDDLDRCEPTQVAQTLATLNFVFTNQAPCFVVMAMDKSYVQHALGIAYKDIAQATHTEHSDPKTAQLAFAEQYLRKLVQLELNLSHDRALGAQMILGSEPHAQTDDPLADRTGEHLGRHPGPGNLGTWFRACWRYIAQRACRPLAMAKPYSPLAVSKSVLRGLVYLGTGVVAVSTSALRWLGQWSRRGLRDALDSGLHRLESLGNLFFIAATSYVLAVLLIAVVSAVIPGLVPKVVPDTIDRAVTVEPAKGKSDAVSAAAPVANASQSGRQDEGNAPTMSVLPPSMNTAALWWPSINLLALIIFGGWVAIRASQTVRDSEGFLLAVRHWHSLMAPQFSNPREWRRLSNSARFLAMRVRVDQYQPRSIRLRDWWNQQLSWSTVVLSKATSEKYPSAHELNPDPIALSEGAVIELWMIDSLSRGQLRSAIRAVVDSDGKLSSEPEAFLFTACIASKPTEAEDLVNSSHTVESASVEELISNEGLSLSEAPLAAEQLLTLGRMLKESPNLQVLFQLWRDKPETIAQLMRKWLTWTEGVPNQRQLGIQAQ